MHVCVYVRNMDKKRERERKREREKVCVWVLTEYNDPPIRKRDDPDRVTDVSDRLDTTIIDW